MGGSSSKSDSSSESGMQFDQNVWSPQGSALTDLYGQAGSLFGQSNEGMQNLTPGATQQMQGVFDQSNPAWQQQMQGGAFQGMDLQGQYNDLMSQGPNQTSNMQDINAMIMGGSGNNYADAMRDQYTQDATRAQQNMLGNLDARAAASGMSGGSRHGTATAQGMDDINRNLQSNMANVGYQTFDKDLDRKLSIAQQADSNNLARYQSQLGSAQNMLGAQQGAMQGGLNYGGQMQNLGMGQFAPQMAPWQAMNAYGGAIGAPTVLSSGSGTMFGDSSSKGMSGGMGGGK